MDLQAAQAAIADARSSLIDRLAAARDARVRALDGADPRGAPWPAEAHALIVEGRSLGVTWRAMAAALGVSQPAVIALAHRGPSMSVRPSSADEILVRAWFDRHRPDLDWDRDIFPWFDQNVPPPVIPLALRSTWTRELCNHAAADPTARDSFAELAVGRIRQIRTNRPVKPLPDWINA